VTFQPPDPYYTLQTAGNLPRFQEDNMPHFLCQATYTAAALKAQLDNPVNREDAVRKLIEAAGGKLHSMFYSYGEHDAVILSEGADDIMIGMMAIVKGSGAFEKVEMTRLYTGPEKLSAFKNAARLQSSFQPPAT
jgi:uncharacterized protein with GYD domain